MQKTEAVAALIATIKRSEATPDKKRKMIVFVEQRMQIDEVKPA